MKDFWDKKITRWVLIAFSFVIVQTPYALSTLEGIQVYQKNLHLSEEHKQKLADDIDRYYNADNMWDVIRTEFSLPHYEDNPDVQQQIGWFLNNQDYLMRSAERAAPYLYFISEQARRRHLPAEVVLLPMIESSYNPFNYSTAGAAGIWQLMPGTASGYGVKQNWWYDGRRDVVQSTQAALDYLVYLGNFFDGNWLLAIAAYDTGEGNILSAIRKNNRNGISTEFWSLPVAQETRIYVPRLLALAAIIAHPKEYKIEFPAVSNATYLAQVDVGGQIDLSHAAELAGLSLKQLKKLNPGYNRTTTDPNGPFKIILPIENVAQFAENLMDSPLYEKVHWIHYKIKSGDTLTTIAKKFNTTPASIKKINALSSNQLKAGTKLIVPQSGTVIAKNTTAITHALEKIQKKYTLQPGDTLYMVRKNDTVPKIAARFHVSVNNLLAANHSITPRVLVYGQQLIIPTHSNKNSSSKKYEIVSGDTVYMVRRGDTLDKIADKFHTSAPAIRVANLMVNSVIREGDQIVIPTHG